MAAREHPQFISFLILRQTNVAPTKTYYSLLIQGIYSSENSVLWLNFKAVKLFMFLPFEIQIERSKTTEWKILPSTLLNVYLLLFVV